MIEFREVEKRYPNGYEALRHINLTIDQGEFVAIIGLSGAGKSTLIRTINRMHDITQGTLTVDGTDVMSLHGKSLRKFRRKIGMIFQSFNLITRTTVIKNVLTAFVPDLPHAVQSDSYGSAFARLASGQVDILCTYADARRDYEDEWTGEYGMTNSIWDDTAVVGVTPAIYNDTISVSKTSPIMDDDFKAALSEAFINIGNTEEGKEVIAIYSHNGYLPAQSSDYDSERAAQEMIQSLNSAG